MSKSNADSDRMSRFARCLALVIAIATNFPAGVYAQDDSTQRPLPLPTNDLPDMSQQLELLRKLRAVMQSREDTSKSASESGKPPARSGESQAEPMPPETTPSGQSESSSKPKTDAQQMSQLQNALKNLSDRLPKDFVPPSLDSIPKEDLKKALENPAIRKSMQEMLKQFARDGVIPPPAPNDGTQSPPLPMPPSDRNEKSKQEDGLKTEQKLPSDLNKEETKRDETPTKPDPAVPTPDEPKSSDNPTETSDPATTDSESSAESKPVPPSSLKSLQDFMKKLASQSPAGASGSGRGENKSGSEPASPQRDRSGPMRRRDTSRVPSQPMSPGQKNLPKEEPAAPRLGDESSPGGTSPLTEHPRADAPSDDTSQSENSAGKSAREKFGPADSGMPSVETQQKALKALQDVMEEMEREQQELPQGSAPTESSDGSLPGNDSPTDTESPIGQSKPSPLDMLKNLTERGSKNDTGSSASGEDGPSSEMSEADKTFVQEFLRQELERMNNAPSEPGDERGSKSDMNPERDPNTLDEPFNGPMNNRGQGNVPPTQIGFRPQTPTGTNGNAPRNTRPNSPKDMSPQSPQRPDMNSSRRNAPNGSQPESRVAGQGRSGMNTSPNSQAMNPPAMNPLNRPSGDAQRSAMEIQKELEQRGVMETLKKTWEKSVQESRNKRQQELRQRQLQAQEGSGNQSSSPVNPAQMGSQLEELAKTLRDSPNAEKAITDMIDRVAKDMAKQGTATGPERVSSPSDSIVQTPRGPLSSVPREIPGQSMLRSMRDSVSNMLSEPESSPLSSQGSAGEGSSSFGAPDLSMSFDFSPVLILAGILAAIALGFYILRAVRHRQTAEAALIGMAPPIQPSQILTRADIVRAFHEMATKSARSVQSWWTHRKVQKALTSISPEKQQAVETLVETYEQARYLPQDQDLSPDQIQSARSALQQLQS